MNFLRPLHPRPPGTRTWRANPKVKLISEDTAQDLEDMINTFITNLDATPTPTHYYIQDIKYHTAVVSNMPQHSALVHYQVWTPV